MQLESLRSSFVLSFDNRNHCYEGSVHNIPGIHAMNQFDVNSLLKDHVFIRMFSVWGVVHIVYFRTGPMRTRPHCPTKIRTDGQDHLWWSAEHISTECVERQNGWIIIYLSWKSRLENLLKRLMYSNRTLMNSTVRYSLTEIAIIIRAETNITNITNIRIQIDKF